MLPPMEPTPAPGPPTRRRSAFAWAAVVLLGIAGFGWSSVGVPLLLAQLTDPAWMELPGGDSPLPATLLSVGLASIGGAIGIWRGTRWGVPFVAATQGLVAIGLLAVYLAGPVDEVLLVAGISGAAAVLAVLDAAARRSSSLTP
jgi:hypothetical protein